MNPLFFDVETLKFPLADPFNPNGKLMYVGVDDGITYTDFCIEFGSIPYGERLGEIQKRVQSARILVGANPKFDLHWLRRYGIVFSNTLIWDVLLVQFILNHQTTMYNSLNEVAAEWGLGQKLDVVKTEYWDKGMDTNEVPEPTLQEYLKQDVQLTKQVYQLQYAEVVRRGLLPLISLHNQDVLMLEEMEWNGCLYDVAGSRKEAARMLWEVRGLKHQLNALAPKHMNWGSPDKVSQILYGGTYKYQVKEPYTFVYKDGSTKEKEHWVEKVEELTRLVTPPKVARAKEGFWPTDEATLKKLKVTGTAKKIVTILLEVRTKTKLVGTYLKGFPSKVKEANWEGNLIHPSYCQIKAVTGRLACSEPNVQNLCPDCKPFMLSRYGDTDDT